jgi:hypothetical protein
MSRGSMKASDSIAHQEHEEVHTGSFPREIGPDEANIQMFSYKEE